LFFYDFFLTLPQEVNKIWRRKVTIATVLFLLNRYVFMMSRGMRTVQAVSWHHFFEQDTNRVCHVHLLRSLVVIAAIRIFAIWERNHIIFTFVLAVGLISPIVTKAVTAALFECAVIILTWIKTAHIQRALRSINSAEGSKGISYLLLRHG
ncbi:hypothetical protein BDY19DRAFT_858844, partial [Irpex rosettiformis]